MRDATNHTAISKLSAEGVESVEFANCHSRSDKTESKTLEQEARPVRRSLTA
jgi:hypothetical protein